MKLNSYWILSFPIHESRFIISSSISKQWQQGKYEGRARQARPRWESGDDRGKEKSSEGGKQWPRAKLAVDGAEIVRDDPGLAERAREGKDSAAKGGREGEKEKIRG